MTDMDEIRELTDSLVDEAKGWATAPPPRDAAVAERRSALLQRVEALREERDLYRRQVEVRYGKAEEQIERLAAERDAALAAEKRAEEERDEAKRCEARIGDSHVALLHRVGSAETALAALRAALGEALASFEAILACTGWATRAGSICEASIAGVRRALAPAPRDESAAVRCPHCGNEGCRSCGLDGKPGCTVCGRLPAAASPREAPADPGAPFPAAPTAKENACPSVNESVASSPSSAHGSGSAAPAASAATASSRVGPATSPRSPRSTAGSTPGTEPAGVSGATRGATTRRSDAAGPASPGLASEPREGGDAAGTARPDSRDAHRLLTCGCGPISTVDCKCCGAKAGAPCAILNGVAGLAAMAESRNVLAPEVRPAGDLCVCGHSTAEHTGGGDRVCWHENAPGKRCHCYGFRDRRPNLHDDLGSLDRPARYCAPKEPAGGR